jgi:hypothetical protein
MDAVASTFLNVYSNPFSTEILLISSTRVQTPQDVSLRRTHVGFYVFRRSRREILVYCIYGGHTVLTSKISTSCSVNFYFETL